MKGTVTTKVNEAKKPALDCCHRCGGLMVSESLLTLGRWNGIV